MARLVLGKTPPQSGKAPYQKAIASVNDPEWVRYSRHIYGAISLFFFIRGEFMLYWVAEKSITRVVPARCAISSH